MCPTIDVFPQDAWRTAHDGIVQAVLQLLAGWVPENSSNERLTIPALSIAAHPKIAIP